MGWCVSLSWHLLVPILSAASADPVAGTMMLWICGYPETWNCLHAIQLVDVFADWFSFVVLFL